MNKVSILDCTLRDGLRITDCKFLDHDIKLLLNNLSFSGIEYIEIGFLRSKDRHVYKGNSTFFNSVDQIEQFIPKKSSAKYLAFVDYSMFDFKTLQRCNNKSITGIRVGFTKRDYLSEMNKVIKDFQDVKKKGYKLFIQGVNSLSYTAEELLDICRIVNKVKPYSFGIVDTYGSMGISDLERIYNIIDNNINENICIDFHSHNNHQLSFALAQAVIDINNRKKKKRKIIIDSTLNGIGKCAGNLNTELIVDFLNNAYARNYNFDLILDSIDEYISPIGVNQHWGYSIPALIGSKNNVHPNNVIYLCEKFRLSCKDIKNIVSMIKPDKKHFYDYVYLENLYYEYSNCNVDDSKAMEMLSQKFNNKSVLVICPGSSILSYKDQISNYINKKHPIVISVNFIHPKSNFAFFGNKKRYMNTAQAKNNMNVIISSNIKDVSANNIVVNYGSLVDKKYKYYDNSTFILLKLLQRLGIKELMFAGFDGYIKHNLNYFSKDFANDRHQSKFDELNKEFGEMINDYIQQNFYNIKVKFLTPSIYERFILHCR